MDLQYNDWQHRRNKSRMILGIAIAGFGVLLLLRMFDLLPPVLYSLHFGWPLILIVIGLAIGAKSNFRNNAWWILILIGGANLLPPFYIGNVPSKKIAWALLLIIVGLAIVF